MLTRSEALTGRFSKSGAAMKLSSLPLRISNSAASSPPLIENVSDWLLSGSVAASVVTNVEFSATFFVAVSPLRHIPYDANRCLEIISKMFNLAEMWGLRPDGSNPRKHIKKYPEEKRERFLSPAELKRVGEVLREMEEEGIELPSAIAAARLLILTGCRLGEIMTLRWEHVDIPGKALRLPDSKTGAKVVHLGQPAIDVLKKIERLRG